MRACQLLNRCELSLLVTTPATHVCVSHSHMMTSCALQGGRQRGQPGLPLHDRRSSGGGAPADRHAARDNRGSRNASLGPRNAGVQKVHGRPLRNQPPSDRRQSSGPAFGHSHPPGSRHDPNPRRASHPSAMLDRPPPMPHRGGGPGAPPRGGALPPPVLPREYGPPPSRGPISNTRLPSSRGAPPARAPLPPNRMAPPPVQSGPAYALPPHVDPRSGLSPDGHRPLPSGPPARRGAAPGPRQPLRGGPQSIPAPRGREEYVAAPHADGRPINSRRPDPNGPPVYGAAAPLQPNHAPRRGAPAAQRQPAVQRGSSRPGPGPTIRVGTPRGEAPGARAEHRQQSTPLSVGIRVGPPRGSALAGSSKVDQRQVQQPNTRYQSPLAPPAQLPTPRMGPPASTLRDNAPRGARDSRKAAQHDRPRSQSRGRPAPAAAAYGHDQRAPPSYARSNLAPVLSPPVQYESAPYLAEPHADPYGPGPVGRGGSQQHWGPEGSQGMDYQQGPASQHVRSLPEEHFDLPA